MRWSTLLSLVQTACLVFLVVHAVGDEPASPAAPSPTVSLAPAWATPLGAAPAGATSPAADEALLRQIIREELAIAGGTVPAARSQYAPPMDAEEARRRKAQIAQQINYFRSVGKVSEQQMAELEGAIAQLDPAGRREMLGLLSRAINAQEIRTRL